MKAWRTALLVLVTPVLVGGFTASALANRWIFALWALAAAVVCALALRRGMEVWWGRPAARARILVRVAAVLAPAVALFAWLVARHQEILDLGLHAVWPALYTPAAARPATYYALAAAVALAGAVGWVAAARTARAARSSRRAAPAHHPTGGSDG